MSAKRYTEENFEDHIVGYLTGDAAGYSQLPSHAYDTSLCLIPDEVVGFIKATQPKEYQKLEKQYGANTDHNLCQRLAREVSMRGTLDVLRKGFKDRGAKFRLAYFRPASGMNPEHHALYSQNRFAVVRQLKFSDKNTKSLDVALFLNGLPIITAELKNSLTGQKVEDAIKQYRKDRDPKEPLFQFKRCLVHFAVGNEKVYMTTRLRGDATYFLPFNKGTENPVNPDGHETAYLWEDIWRRDTLLDLLQNYLLLEHKSEKVYDPKKGEIVTKESEILIFPRYHQLDVVRFLLDRARRDGVGTSCLVQHSAGSGKSNSIAWLAHGLVKLFSSGTAKIRVFDSIVVITDRRVLDQQLQDTIKQFEQKTGVVVPITKTSAQLKEALENGRDIIVTTLQKFPVISDAMTTLQGSRFAVIIDEAHSSQSGESAKHLKKALSVNLEDAEAEDEEEEFDLQEEVVSEIRTRGKQNHISYFAFTATPKNKTLELFGRKTDDGFVAHHIYSMRQAIEEGFILDVLSNYTTFARYFKLVKAVEEDDEYEKRKAVRALTSYVDLQPHAIEAKTRIMLDHFADATRDAIQGKGRAMLVTRSRLHCVRYYHAFRKAMKEDGLPFKPLVAFSGTVKDKDTGLEYTENRLNQLPPRVSIKEALKLPEYRILIVANKFQTGFDEPYLHTMWVDKRLGGVQAVQTLSRLNRTAKGKTDPVVLDFVNDTEAVQDAFQDYYQTTYLEEETDPNKLYDLETRLNQFELYIQDDIDEFAAVFFDERQPGEKLQPPLKRVSDAWRQRGEDEREDFRSTLQAFIRLYAYVSQLIDFQDPDLEKLYVFARNLNKKLKKRQGSIPFEIADAVDLDSFRIQQTFEGSIQLDQTDKDIAGIPTSASTISEPEMDYLSNIVNTLNDLHGIDLTEKDKIHVRQIIEDVENDEGVIAVMNGNNTASNKERKVNQVIDDKLLDVVHTSIELYKKLNEPHINEAFKRQLFRKLQQQFRQ